MNNTVSLHRNRRSGRALFTVPARLLSLALSLSLFWALPLQAGHRASYSISPTSASFAYSGGSGSVTITTSSSASWTVSNVPAWITGLRASGTGSATLTYSVAANTATTTRSATLTIATKSFTVSQAGAPACTYSLSPTSASPGYGAASGALTVTASSSNCAWTASSSATAWLTCSPASGSGTATVNWSATANTSTNSRSAYLTVAGQTFSVAQAGDPPPSCTYSISPASASFASTASSGSVSVTTTTGCAWTASNNGFSWITITGGASGSGNGAVSYSVTANTSSSARSGTLTIAGQTCTVSQAGASSGPANDYFANATPISGPSVTVTGSNVGATAEPGEPYIMSYSAPKASVWWSWTAPASGSVTVSTAGSSFDTMLGVFTGTSVSALTVVAANDDVGGGLLTSLVTFNAVAGTTYAIDVDGYQGATGNISLSLSTAGGCTYAITPTGASFTASGGTGSLNVSAGSGCSWTASNNGLSWITITGGASGSGNGTVSYSVASNTSTSSRSGNLTVAGQTYTVSQAGASCTYAVTPTSASFTSTGGGGSISVTSASGCTWTASNNGFSWITITGGASGSGNGTVTYSVAANTGSTPLTGTLIVAGQTFTVSEAGVACTYAITPTSASFTSAAASGSIGVTSASGCTWTASNNGSSWITVTGGASGSGNGTVSYSVASNTSTSSRSGNLTVAGQTCTVSQSGASCTYAITPTSASFISNGGGGSISVTSASGCSWTASNNGFSWITITGGASGSGNGTVTYSVAANTSSTPLTGTLTVAGQTFNVSEAGVACTYAITPTSASLTANGGGGSISVTSASGCGWTASNNGYSWITITGGASGSGNGSVTYSVAANTGSTPLTGTLTVAGQTFTVSEAGVACTYAITPASASFTSAAGSGSISVTSASGCTWTASNNGSSWITVTGGASGSGNGTVSYSVASNTGTSSRSGNLTVAGQTCTVSQAGTTCTYAITPTSASFTSSGGSGSISVTSASGCTWTASNNGSSWITITGGASGSGNGTVSYTVAVNTNASSLTGTMAVAGQTFTVTEAVDTIPPTVSLTAPGSGSTVSGTVSATASASDPVGVSRVEFYRDSTNLVGTATAAPYSAADDTTKVSNGSHSYCAKAYDPVGNWATSPSSSVTVSNAAALPGASCIWERHFGGSVTGVDSAHPFGAKEDHNGNVVVVGQFFGTVNFGGGPLTSAGYEDAFVLKYDGTGAFQWARRFGSLGTDKVTAVAIDSSNNIVVVGSFCNTVDFGGASLTSAGSSDIFVVKYGADGTLLWAKSFGGTAGESCNGVALDAANNILITGYYGYWGTAVDFGGGPLPLPGGTTAMAEDVFVAKLSASGGYLWAKGYGGSSGYDVGNGIAVDGNGDVLVVGSFQGSLNLGGSTLTSAGGYDVFVAKYAGSTGTPVWSVSGGGTGNDLGRAVAVDASGNVVVTGEFMGTAIIGGSTLNSPYNPGLTGLFLAKYSAAGAPVWSQGFVTINSFGLASGRGVAVDGAGNIVLTGAVDGAVGFGNDYLGNGCDDIVLAKFSGSGGLVWVKAYGGSALNDVGEGVSIGASNNILVTGYFGDPVDFGCGSMTSACNGDGFAAKLSP